ncbi:Uncharacterized protein YpgQ [Linum perenne]
MGPWADTVKKAEQLVETTMKDNDASHDASHVWRVRNLALSLASEEGLSSHSDSLQIVELAALLHDIGDYKYLRDPSEEKIVEKFLEEEGIDEIKKVKILSIIKGMGIARCFTFGGSRNRVLHDPAIHPRLELSKEQYVKKEEQTTINHFHEKLVKLKDLMKTEAGKKRAEQRHKFMNEYLKQFYDEWDGRA